MEGQAKLSDFQGRVLAFQKRWGLTADAIVGPETWGEVEDIETTLGETEAALWEKAKALGDCEARHRGDGDESDAFVWACVVSALVGAGLMWVFG